MTVQGLVPWWHSLTLRPEIIDASGQIDDVQMSLYNAVYAIGERRPAYADPSYYSEITHPTERLIDLLVELAIRLGGGQDYTKARALTRLDQGMGGGKSHACIGAYHLATSPEVFSAGEVGKAVYRQARQRLSRDLPKHLNKPVVVVMPCDNMTPGAPDEKIDGPAKTLYERFLWRLFSPDYSTYERYKPFFNNKAKIADALIGLHRPVLIIIDEIMNYLGNASDKDSVLAGQDLEFMRALLDTVNDVPHVAAIVVMIASDKDPMTQSELARERRLDLNALLERNGMPATVTANADFAAILRRRLFQDAPPAELIANSARVFESILNDPAWKKNVWDNISAPWRDDFPHAVGRTYPFHPQLMHLAEHEWAAVSGFQRVRSTMRIFAATIFAQRQRALAGGWTPLLIGPGDLPLSYNNVREAILGSGLVEDDRTVANYRALAENEIVNHADDAGAARRLDLTRESALWSSTNPRAAERGATFVFLSSIVGTRPGGRRGASANEIKAATVVPDAAYGVADADGVVEELANPERGMSAIEVVPGQGYNKPARYYLSTRLTLRMLVNNLRRTLSGEADKSQEEGRPSWRDSIMAEFADRLSNSGPFRRKICVAADLARSPSDVLATAGIDDARTTRLVVLDPAQFSLRNGIEKDTLSALKAILGLQTGATGFPVEWASSAVFAVVNTQRRTHARGLAVEYQARRLALETPEVKADDDLKETGTRELADAKVQLEKAIKRAFQHIVFLAQPDAEGARTMEVYTFEDDNQTALDGTQVWKALVERDKAFDSGQFSSKALLHNLRAQDYGRPLAEIRDAFWSAPRLPLLYAGEADLRRAVFDAVTGKQLKIVDGAGEPVAVTDASQINLSSTGLRLEPFVAPPPEVVPPPPGPGPIGPTPPPPAEPAEKYVTFPLLGSLMGDDTKSDNLAAVFRSLYVLLDERKATYVQGTMQLVLESGAAEDLAKRLRELGLNVAIRDQ